MYTSTTAANTEQQQQSSWTIQKVVCFIIVYGVVRKNCTIAHRFHTTHEIQRWIRFGLLAREYLRKEKKHTVCTHVTAKSEANVKRNIVSTLTHNSIAQVHTHASSPSCAFDGLFVSFSFLLWLCPFSMYLIHAMSISNVKWDNIRLMVCALIGKTVRPNVEVS